ncbi:MAG: polyprenol phosphomannose-dependent alpha 1,6 mannosyltransferase MptB [Nocardioides sp.]|nr:polyprenol phosphomannose-dependent alpha 1,6 mannosyltransferase MptB [Nocardioides sp.]
MLSRGLTGSCLVLLGGLVVSVLPGSSWLQRSQVLALLRETEVGRMLGLTVVMAGLGLLAHSWLVLCRRVSRAREESVAGRIATTRLAAAIWSLPLLVAPPLFSRDGWSYAAQGMLAQWGLSPYRYGPGMLHGPVSETVDPRWMYSPTPYGPVPLAFGRSFASVSENPWVLVVAHRGLAVLGLLLLAWAVPRLATWSGVNPALASALVLASPFMLANGIGGLHNDLLMVGLMAAALVVAAERGWVWGAVLGGLAASVKAPAGIICIGVALVTLPVAVGLAERARRLASVAVASVGVLLGAGVLFGTGAGWLQALTVPGTVNTPLSITTLLGGALDALVQALGLGTAEATFLSLVRLVGTLVALGVAGWVAVRGPSGDRSAALRGMTLAIGTLVLLSPVVHLWYFLWVLPFAASQRLSRVAMTGLVGLSVVLGLVAPLDSSLHEAYLAIVLGTMLVAALVLVLLLTPGARDRLGRISQHTAGSTRPVTSPRVSRPPVTEGAE